MINEQSAKLGTLLYSDVQILGYPVTAPSDSGSLVSIINSSLVEKLFIPIKHYTGPKVYSGTGTIVTTYAKSRADIEITNFGEQTVSIQSGTVIGKFSEPSSLEHAEKAFEYTCALCSHSKFNSNTELKIPENRKNVN